MMHACGAAEIHVDRGSVMCPSGNQSQERAPGEFNLVPSGPKQRAERKKVPALAQARTVDLILVTELTRWSRSTRFAARALTCFKFRFVSSPLIRRIDSCLHMLRAE